MADEFVIRRDVRIAASLVVELRVSRATAAAWSGDDPQELPWRHAFAAARALREAYDLLEARGILEGRWRVSWVGTTVVVESVL